MACCLTALGRYLNQFRLVFNEVFWNSPQGNFTRIYRDGHPWHEFENYLFRIQLNLTGTSEVSNNHQSGIISRVDKFIHSIHTIWLFPQLLPNLQWHPNRKPSWHPSGKWRWFPYNTDGLMQKRRNSSALAMELRLSCTNPSICCPIYIMHITSATAIRVRPLRWDNWPGYANGLRQFAT